jgi:indole-3-glycerol phosphate synthase
MSQNILHTILETKRKEVAELCRQWSLPRLQQLASAAPPPRPFRDALTRPSARPVNLIAEIKKASPSKGLIREDFDPPTLAQAYKSAGADALSILTDETYFQGHLDFLRAVRKAVDLPILRKDFIIDEYQVYEARAAGTDAILLIAAALETGRLAELAGLAGQLGMAVLLEVHNDEELTQILSIDDLDARADWLLGINNRDLTTFKVDLDTTLRLMERVGDDVAAVSESGITTRRDVDRLAAAGVRAILVGETFMRAEDIGGAVEDLLGPRQG